ncbi:hypothetical protein EZV73_06955 [Acidaminobacter sp. JC074]|uniref:hypothetical protein n=1 Tax=Acidaminobacter sp. JC074 TaxID=2530199 RepID=UPI001F0FD2BF|nr:hypothetical protein [Acidaminobacter sp. JC074]MCH4887303.1 hypothetical protein [Acidaminobacter sp. JC074]
MIKKASIIALAFSILVSGGAYAETKAVKLEDTTVDWEYSFVDEKDYLKDLNVNKDDMKSLEKLFDEAVKLDQKGDFEASMKKWDAYNEILSKYIKDGLVHNWEMERDYLKDMGLSDSQLSNLEKLFNEAVKDNGKWDAYQAALEKMLPELNETIAISYEMKWEDEAAWLKDLGLQDKEISTLKTLFDQAKKDDAKWDAYYKALEDLMPEAFKPEPYTFDQEKDWLKEMEISSDDMQALEKIFNEALKLQEADKYDQADKKWDDYYKILDKYQDAFIIEPSMEMKWEDEASWLKDLGLEDKEISKLKTLFEDAKKDEDKWEAYHKALEELMPEEYKPEPYSFDQEKEWLKDLKLTSDDMTAIEKLFDEAVKLEEASKYDEANKKWDDYYKILDKYEGAFTIEPVMEMKWEDEAAFLKDLGLNNDEISKLKVLFEAAKKDDSKWEAYYDALGKHDLVTTCTAEAAEAIKWEDESSWLNELGLKTDDLSKLEKLFNEAVKLDSEGKYDDAYDKWDAYNEILGQYLNETDAYEIMD